MLVACVALSMKVCSVGSGISLSLKLDVPEIKASASILQLSKANNRGECG